MNKEELLQKFYEHFGEGGNVVTVFSPGRVNLIGEHTDYNGGFPARSRSARISRAGKGTTGRSISIPETSAMKA